MIYTRALKKVKARETKERRLKVFIIRSNHDGDKEKARE